MHSTGASFFFVVVSCTCSGAHIRFLQTATELIWIIGMLIHVALMAEAFWVPLALGQMSYWGRR
jgi:ubiquinol-cytochrome c reductase cytochrome b subunit